MGTVLVNPFQRLSNASRRGRQTLLFDQELDTNGIGSLDAMSRTDPLRETRRAHEGRWIGLILGGWEKVQKMGPRPSKRKDWSVGCSDGSVNRHEVSLGERLRVWGGGGGRIIVS